MAHLDVLAWIDPQFRRSLQVLLLPIPRPNDQKLAGLGFAACSWRERLVVRARLWIPLGVAARAGNGSPPRSLDGGDSSSLQARRQGRSPSARRPRRALRGSPLRPRPQVRAPDLVREVDRSGTGQDTWVEVAHPRDGRKTDDVRWIRLTSLRAVSRLTPGPGSWSTESGGTDAIRQLSQAG